MKRTAIFFRAAAIALFSLVMLASCSKDGEMGEQGKQGEKGEQGIQGEVGPAGADGSIIYSGEGDPAETTGVEGDYYLNIATGSLIGPKLTDDTWADTNGFSLKGNDGEDGNDGSNGEDGEDGQDGSNILSGNGSPGLEIGVDGDFYLDKDSYILYGPKSHPTGGIGGVTLRPNWGAGLELKGKDGNANVRTFRMTIGGDDWSDWASNTNYGFYQYKTRFEAFTEDVYNNGFILVYLVTGSALNPLPLIGLSEEKNLLKEDYRLVKNASNYELYIKRTLEYTSESNGEELEDETHIYRIKLVTGKEAEELATIAHQNKTVVGNMSMKQVNEIIGE